MSRFHDYHGDEQYPNEWALWQKRAELALNGKRGRKALGELREALMALPEHRLIAGALCTVGIERRIEEEVGPVSAPGGWTEFQYSDYRGSVERQGEGVCAIGAYVWHQKVKAGMDPEQAFAEIPTSLDASEDTVGAGKAAGLTFTLAWELANANDEEFGGLTPEARFEAFVAFIDRVLARPPLQRPAPKPKREPRRRPSPAGASGMPSLELGL